VAVDVSPTFAAAARATCAAHPNVEVREIAACDLESLRGETFDFAYSFNVFIHLNAYETFLYLRQVAALLAPGAGFSFNASAVRPGLLDHFRYFAAEFARDPAGIHGYMSWTDLETLRVLAGEAGFDPDASRFREENGHLWALARKG
jgi:hypothetical protein